MTVASKVVINCAGPWSDNVRHSSRYAPGGAASLFDRFSGSVSFVVQSPASSSLSPNSDQPLSGGPPTYQGSSLLLPPDAALVVHSNAVDGKSFFVFPWKDQQQQGTSYLIGASDVPLGGPPPLNPVLAAATARTAGAGIDMDASGSGDGYAAELAFVADALAAYAGDDARAALLTTQQRMVTTSVDGGGGGGTATASPPLHTSSAMSSTSSLLRHPDDNPSGLTASVMTKGYAVDATTLEQECTVRLVGGSWLDVRSMARDALDAVEPTLALAAPRRLEAGGSRRGDGTPTASPSSRRYSAPLSGWQRLVGGAAASPEPPTTANPGDGGTPPPIGTERGASPLPWWAHLRREYGDLAPLVWRLLLEHEEDRGGQPVKKGAAAALLQGPLIEGLPHRGVEVLHHCRAEWAQSVVDVIARRTSLAYLDPQRCATEAVPKVAAILAVELGWTQARRDAEEREAYAFLRGVSVVPLNI